MIVLFIHHNIHSMFFNKNYKIKIHIIYIKDINIFFIMFYILIKSNIYKNNKNKIIILVFQF